MKMRWFEILVLALAGCAAAFLLGCFLTARLIGDQTVQITAENRTFLGADESSATETDVSGDADAADTGADAQQEPKGDSGDAKATPEHPVNINTATVEELDTLPNIGAVKAQAIVDYRTANGPFATVDDLILVDGIGEKTVEQLRDYVTVDGER